MKYYIYSSEQHKYLELELPKDARAKKQKKSLTYLNFGS